MPELLDHGHIFIAQPPLYKATKGKSSRYLKDEPEMQAFLVDQGTEGEVLALGSGEHVSGEDLRRLVREAAGVKALIDRLHARAPDPVLEHAAIAGALNVGAGAAEAAATAQRLNAIAEEGEANWAAFFDRDRALVLERVVRGVTERVVLDGPLLGSADARRLAERHAMLTETYARPGELRGPKENQTIHGPLSLLSAVLSAGRKGLAIQRYKGLGEMNADQLWETTLDPEFRTLLQVRVDHADDADDLFTKLMGDVVEPRREFIQENALDAAVDV
jgi:DNA gyrase subunit B